MEEILIDNKLFICQDSFLSIKIKCLRGLAKILKNNSEYTILIVGMIHLKNRKLRKLDFQKTLIGFSLMLKRGWEPWGNVDSCFVCAGDKGSCKVVNHDHGLMVIFTWQCLLMYHFCILLQRY